MVLGKLPVPVRLQWNDVRSLTVTIAERLLPAAASIFQIMLLSLKCRRRMPILHFSGVLTRQFARQILALTLQSLFFPLGGSCSYEQCPDLPPNTFVVYYTH